MKANLFIKTNTVQFAREIVLNAGFFDTHFQCIDSDYSYKELSDPDYFDDLLTPLNHLKQLVEGFSLLESYRIDDDDIYGLQGAALWIEKYEGVVSDEELNQVKSLIAEAGACI